MNRKRLPRADRVVTGRRPGAAWAWLVVAATLGVVTARAEDDIVAEEAPSTALQPSIIVFDQQIEGMLGGWRENDLGGSDRAGINTGRMLEADLVAQVCGLSDEQRASCAAAAALEAARATEGIDRLRRKYAGRSADFQTLEGQQEWQRFHQDFSAAQAVLTTPMFGRSLLSRVINGILDDEQRGTWEAEMRARDARRWRVVVDGAMEVLERQVGLNSAQHEAITGLLMAKPLRVDATKFRNRFGDSPEILAGLALSRLEEDAVDPLLGERQRARFREAAQRGRMWQTMLEQMDILEK